MAEFSDGTTFAYNTGSSYLSISKPNSLNSPSQALSNEYLLNASNRPQDTVHSVKHRVPENNNPSTPIRNHKLRIKRQKVSFADPLIQVDQRHPVIFTDNLNPTDLSPINAVVALETLRSANTELRSRCKVIQQREAQFQVQVMQERNALLMHCMEKFLDTLQRMNEFFFDHNSMEDTKADATKDTSNFTGTTNLPVPELITHTTTTTSKHLGPSTTLQDPLLQHSTQHWASSCPSNYSFYQQIYTSLDLLRKPFQYFSNRQWDRGRCNNQIPSNSSRQWDRGRINSSSADILNTSQISGAGEIYSSWELGSAPAYILGSPQKHKHE